MYPSSKEIMCNKADRNLQNMTCTCNKNQKKQILFFLRSLIISFFSINSRSREVHEITYMTQDLKVSRGMITPSS